MAHTMNLRVQEFITHFNAEATEVESQMASEEDWKGGSKASYGNVIKREHFPKWEMSQELD